MNIQNQSHSKSETENYPHKNELFPKKTSKISKTGPFWKKKKKKKNARVLLAERPPEALFMWAAWICHRTNRHQQHPKSNENEKLSKTNNMVTNQSHQWFIEKNKPNVTSKTNPIPRCYQMSPACGGGTGVGLKPKLMPALGTAFRDTTCLIRTGWSENKIRKNHEMGLKKSIYIIIYI